jgi:hypothetical protein
MGGRRWEYRVIEMLPRKVTSVFLSYFNNPVSKFHLTYRNVLIIDTVWIERPGGKGVALVLPTTAAVIKHLVAPILLTPIRPDAALRTPLHVT